MDSTGSLKKRKTSSDQICIKNGIGPEMKLSPELFTDDYLSVGGEVKRKGKVLLEHFKTRCRPPNTSCRIESFGKICQTFDDRRKRWVGEMGFDGLLKIGGDMNLPRQLAYWLMTRIDPLNCTLKSHDGRLFRLSQNQVHWVLGIPNGGMPVPTYQSLNNEMLSRVNLIMERYGKSWYTTSTKTGRQYIFEGIPVTSNLIARLEGQWQEEEVEEFKMLFLLLSLEMLLCPTQSSRLAADLVPALTCAVNAAEFDWCSLVLKKLMDSVAMFARRFYSTGSASGCGGCLIFIVVLYLDRLNRFPVQWGYFPRVEVWNMAEIRRTVREDRLPNSGDFGQIGTVDVAYGETHPCEARDSNGPDGKSKVLRSVCYRIKGRKDSRSRVAANIVKRGHSMCQTVDMSSHDLNKLPDAAI